MGSKKKPSKSQAQIDAENKARADKERIDLQSRRLKKRINDGQMRNESEGKEKEAVVRNMSSGRKSLISTGG